MELNLYQKGFSNLESKRKNIYIYRLETSSGLGVYFSQIATKLGLDTVASRTRPRHWYLDDQVISSKNKYKYAFRNTRQLTNWFSLEEVDKLLGNGIYCNRYLVPRDTVILGEAQLIFDPSAKVAVKNIPIEKIRNWY